jgi:hypothetical protein
MKIRDIDGLEPTLEEEITILESRCLRCNQYFNEEDEVRFVTTDTGKTMAWHALVAHHPCYYAFQEKKGKPGVRYHRPRAPERTIACHFCNKEFKTTYCHRKYCSTDCCLKDRTSYYQNGVKYLSTQVIHNL